ncbi:CCA tRNA nucleotidyltransferase [Durusdinium trenchii]|uniref:Mitochondrial (CCA-adding enzyme) (tRNA CCA-pyrophosphorylase) (tRNA adenylyltransferase) (tRNA nucleotidyltransferase) n=1 Tax=Durusdinium trenchii TaxID=1381693 RepID=A0ABP0Q828_9DINO
MCPSNNGVAWQTRIPKTDAEILHFFLCFLEDQRLPDVPVFINGGYVRDLLLGKEPDDLDLTLCLRGCPEEVTVAALLDEMRGYVESRPEFGLSEFKNATILSNESKDKQLDTFKAHFTNKDGVKTEVDVMPTIGEEKYSDDNRIPIRDQRGLPEEDALRRDLTIGALLLRVQRAPGERGESNGLEFEVFDFYGGVDDLCKGVLRSPCPVNKSVAEVAEVVLRTPEEQEIAKHLKIQELPPDEAVQVLWWSKVLIDDPLRICRALRFAAKFKFELHKAFWLVGSTARVQITKPNDSPKPRAALLLIDMQKAFTTGSWASYFGGRKEVTDIERACEEAAILLKSGRLPSETPILCTKCYLDRAQDEPYLEILEPLLRKRPCIHKPTMDVTYNPAFFQWLHEQVEKGISVLVIGGCTTTSCVRVSSTEIVGQLEEQGLTGKLRVVVDLKLCGARTENFQPTAEAAPVLVQIYGRELCRGKSAVDLAVVQMKRAGVEVLEGWDW